MRPTQRILSIDALRGITILVMIFVNEAAGVRELPVWMKHMPANADAMTFVDMVFPSFLFIVGMSVPFAVNNRLKKGDSFWQLQWHILFRTLGLLTLGFFMVNAEEGIHPATGIPASVWSFLFYICVILIWNIYSFEHKTISYLLKGTGVAGLVILALIYRSGPDGSEHMKPHWWGILGLIGWAYLFACIFYQLLKGNIIGLLLMMMFCSGFYMVTNTSSLVENYSLQWMASQAGNAAHTSLVLAGMVLAKIFFNEKNPAIKTAYIKAILFTAALFLAGYFIRPFFKISKIHATPTWCFYSAAACCIIFMILYWLIDVKGHRRWTTFFKPAATNPLLAYISPAFLYAIFGMLHITVFPQRLLYGVPGVLWAFLFSVAVMYIVKGLNDLKIRLQL
jgi:heparan-alpha-glucosaminide N-acetyltransferase